MIRNPVVSGQFYSGGKEALLEEVSNLVGKPTKEEDAIGVVSPHAGFIYSGPVAGSVYAHIRPKSTYVILGPNHAGLGSPFSLTTADFWKTPLGEAPIYKALGERIKDNSKYIKYDELSHAREHSVEVQLPFLQFLNAGFRFVPIVVSYASLGVYKEVAAALAVSIKEMGLGRDFAIIASTDMTHYESQGVAKKKDSAAIEAVLKLDEDKLVETVETLDISMCGYAPTAIMIAAVKELGAKNAKLVRYQTSGDVSGDYSSVVGYAGIIIS